MISDKSERFGRWRAAVIELLLVATFDFYVNNLRQPKPPGWSNSAATCSSPTLLGIIKAGSDLDLAN